MIRFSRREDYAVILITKLAENFNNRLVSLSEIAREYRISLLFLRNIAHDLRNKDIISAVEGKRGGYRLLKDPKYLKMGEILKAFSTEELLECCATFSDVRKNASISEITKHAKGRCPQEGFCRAGYIWRKLNREFLERVSSLSVSDFMNYR